jgi:alpha-mannosidase
MPLDTIYLIHHTHTDIGFTHEQEVVFDLHCQFIDQAIDLCERTADYPEGSALRWTCECTLPVLRWMQRRSDRQIERFLKLERAGRIEVTGLFATLSQCVSHEGTWRQLYPVRKLRADYGMTIRSAMACDINGYHWGLVDALTDSGIDHFSMAINENVGRAAFGSIRPNGFEWESAAGKRMLVWNGLHYNNNQYFGIPTDYDRAVRELPRFLNWLEQRRYPHPFCLFQATHNTFNDNGPVDVRLADFVSRWNREGRSPRMEIVTMSRFFEELRREPAARLPIHKGEWSDYWNFGATSSAYETQLNRATERRLVEAEWLSCHVRTGEENSRRRDLADAWELALLYDEHTWCSNVSTSQPWSQATRSQLNQKLNYAYRARSKAQLVRLEAAGRLAHSISAQPGRYVLAINSLPWSRKERLTIPRAWLEGYSSPKPQLVLDENELRPQAIGEVHDTVSRVQYLDREDLGEQQGLALTDSLVSEPIEVPAMGYRLCHADDLQTKAVAAPQSTDIARAENDWLIVEMDASRGGIGSLFDKRRVREWVDRDHAQPLGGYIYEQLTATTSNERYGGRMAIYEETDWSRFMGYRGWHADWPAMRRGITKVIGQTIQRLPGATRIRQVCQAPGLKQLIYEATLHDDSSHLDLRITLNKLWIEEPEACYLAFPLDLPGATPRYETVGGIVEPSADQLPGCNQDFPTIQGWADWSTEREGMMLCTPDSPIMMFGGFHFARMHDGARPTTTASFVNMVMTNYYHVNYPPAQHGPVTFYYRLCPHDAFDPAWCNQRAREASSPLWGHPVKDPNGTKSVSTSLLQITNPAVDISACKEPEIGGGLILRFRNTVSEETVTSVLLPKELFQSAWLCDALENPRNSIPLGNGSMELTLAPFATVTCRLEP